jgi:hypothetical protein
MFIYIIIIIITIKTIMALHLLFWMLDLGVPVEKPQPILRTTQTQNKYTETFMLRVGLEPTNSVFEKTETVRTSGERHRCSLILSFSLQICTELNAVSIQFIFNHFI